MRAHLAAPVPLEPVPALIYTTSTSVDFRTGNGPVRTLATFPKGVTGPQQLAWSADGSKVAWVDGQGIGEFIVGRDQVRTWHCGCGSITFQGDRLLSDDYGIGVSASGGPEVLGWALAVWFGPSGTPYASMAPPPPGCAHEGQGTVPSVVVPLQDYRLEAGTWVRSGSGVINVEPTRGGREATLYGKVDSTPLGAGATGLRLVVSGGSSSLSIPGALAFMWAP